VVGVVGFELGTAFVGAADHGGGVHVFLNGQASSVQRLPDISQPVGHSGTAVTEAVYRMQIRPVLQQGAVVMDRIFGETQ
jgi:hypothetical protein